MAEPGEEGGSGWTSEGNLQNHFDRHGSSMGYNNANQYGQGARNNMTAPGTTSAPARNGDGRTGYFNSSTGRLTIVNENGRIITYFEPSRGWEYFNEHFGY